MKRIGIFLVLFVLTIQMSVAQSDIERIRTHYGEMKSYIEEMAKWDAEYPVPTYYKVQIQENYPGTGRHEEEVYIYHEFEPADEDVIFPPKRISFVTSKYNFALRNFYEEFLYDENGEIEFIYVFLPYEIDDMDWELRFYFKDGKLIKSILKSRNVQGDRHEAGALKVVYDGVSVPKKYEDYYKAYFDKSKRYKQLFESISAVQHY